MNNIQKIVFYKWVNSKLGNTILGLEIRILSRNIDKAVLRTINKILSKCEVPVSDLYNYLFWYHIMVNNGVKYGNLYQVLCPIKPNQNLIDNRQEIVAHINSHLQELGLPILQFQKQHLLKAHDLMFQRQKK